MVVEFTRRASADLDQIYDYIAADNPFAAERVVKRIDERCRTLTSLPERGLSLGAVGHPSLRRIIELPYTIVYRVEPQAVFIVTIVRVSRDLSALLSLLDASET